MSLIVFAALIRAALYLIGFIFAAYKRSWDLALLAGYAAFLTVGIAVLGPWAAVLAMPYAGWFARCVAVHSSRDAYRSRR